MSEIFDYFENPELAKQVKENGTTFYPNIFNILNTYDSDNETNKYLMEYKEKILKINDVSKILFYCSNYSIEQLFNQENPFNFTDYMSLSFVLPIKMTDALVAVEDFIKKPWTTSLIPPTVNSNVSFDVFDPRKNAKFSFTISECMLRTIYEGIESHGNGVYEIELGS